MADPGDNMSPGGGYFDWGQWQQNQINDARYNAAMKSITQQYGPQAGAPEAFANTLRNSLFQQTMPAQVAVQNMGPQNLQSEIALRNSQAALAGANTQNVQAGVLGTAANSQKAAQEAGAGAGLANVALTNSATAGNLATAGKVGAETAAITSGADRTPIPYYKMVNGQLTPVMLRVTSNGTLTEMPFQAATTAAGAGTGTAAQAASPGAPAAPDTTAGVTDGATAAPAQAPAATSPQAQAGQTTQSQLIPPSIATSMMVPQPDGSKLVRVGNEYLHAYEPTSPAYQKTVDQIAEVHNVIDNESALQTRYTPFMGDPKQPNSGLIDQAIASLDKVPTSSVGMEIQKQEPTSEYNNYMAKVKQLESISGLADFGNMVGSGTKFGRLSNQVAKMASDVYLNADPWQNRDQLRGTLINLKRSLGTWQALSKADIASRQAQGQTLDRTKAISDQAFHVPQAPAAGTPAVRGGGSAGSNFSW